MATTVTKVVSDPTYPADSLILRADTGGIATLTLNRPAQFNAISVAMLVEMQRALDVVAADKSVRIVVIAGAGQAFSPGHDLKEMLANSNEAFIGDLFRRCCNVMLTIQRLPQPVIAKVHGIATAAGCQIVAACDLAVSAEDARYATSGVNFGLFCATPGVAVSRNISRKRAFEMLMTGEFIDAQTALDWGLVNRIAPVDRLDAETSALAQSMMASQAPCLPQARSFSTSSWSGRWKTPMGSRVKSSPATCSVTMPKEGVSAFVEKRKPRWNV
jgi:enoyl-CoA hydratase/carnithine racemase